MQGTVREFHPGTRSGSVLLDDGTLVEFGRSAFDQSGLRLLRLGQRVRLDIDADGAVRSLTVLTLRD